MSNTHNTTNGKRNQLLEPVCRFSRVRLPFPCVIPFSSRRVSSRCLPSIGCWVLPQQVPSSCCCEDLSHYIGGHVVQRATLAAAAHYNTFISSNPFRIPLRGSFAIRTLFLLPLRRCSGVSVCSLQRFPTSSFCDRVRAILWGSRHVRFHRLFSTITGRGVARRGVRCDRTPVFYVVQVFLLLVFRN